MRFSILQPVKVQLGYAIMQSINSYSDIVLLTEPKALVSASFTDILRPHFIKHLTCIPQSKSFPGSYSITNLHKQNEVLDIRDMLHNYTKQITTTFAQVKKGTDLSGSKRGEIYLGI